MLLSKELLLTVPIYRYDRREETRMMTRGTSEKGCFMRNN